MAALAEWVIEDRQPRGLAKANRVMPPWLYPSLVALAGALAFLLARPAVGDLWAARARQSAAAHGVGLTYWFSWFGGGSTPGNYSVLTPFLSAVIGAALLGALSTVAITPLCWALTQGSRHRLAATWVATVTAGCSLWSGRIPFALGTAIAVAALIAVRRQQPVLAVCCTLLTVLVSPVSGAFVAFGLTGTVLYTRSHRAISALAILTAGFSLAALAMVFGAPGPEGFALKQAVILAVGLSLLLLANPPKYLSMVILLSVAACPLLAVVPNGMGSNFQRLGWICLPAAVIATSRRGLPTALSAATLAIAAGLLGTVHDLAVGRAPMSSPSYYGPLVSELDTIPALTTYRLEVVPDGTHTAAYAILGHAMLARGYETQTDNALNAVTMSATNLNAVTFKIWLDNNAVGYVAMDGRSLQSSTESRLVTSGTLPYLREIWSSSNWRLFQVRSPTPIVPTSDSVVDADQSSLTIDVLFPGRVPVRVRWSKFLTAEGPHGVPGVSLTADGYGWSILTAPQPGRYILHG